jgi:hypothetical protein
LAGKNLDLKSDDEIEKRITSGKSREPRGAIMPQHRQFHGILDRYYLGVEYANLTQNLSAESKRLGKLAGLDDESGMDQNSE